MIDILNLLVSYTLKACRKIIWEILDRQISIKAVITPENLSNVGVFVSYGKKLSLTTVEHLQFSAIQELFSPLSLWAGVVTSCREMTDFAKDLESEHLCSVMHLKIECDSKTHQPSNVQMETTGVFSSAFIQRNHFQSSLAKWKYKARLFVVVQNKQEQIRMVSTGAQKIFSNAHFFLRAAVVHLWGCRLLMIQSNFFRKPSEVG